MQINEVTILAAAASETGPLYPGVGWEVPLFIVCVGFWVMYTIWQMVHEHSQFQREEAELRQSDNLTRAIRDDLRIE